MTAPTKKEILEKALEARNQEILDYQINIDNFSRMIKKIAQEHPQNTDLQEFRTSLIQRLQVEQQQQLRARIIQEVIYEQLQELKS